MKMNLSVVMGVVDKMKAPLQTITQNTSKYSREIESLQEKQRDISSQRAMISGYQNVQRSMQTNAQAIDVAAEKLAELEAKAVAMGTPSAALTAKINKQREALSRLNDDQEAYQDTLDKAQNSFKKAGISVDDLESEFKKLTSEYDDHSQSIEKLSDRYEKLQRRMKPLQNAANKIKMPSVESAQNAASAAVAPLAGLGIMGLVVTDTAKEINSLRKVSEQLKMPVDDLQALRLQATTYGAEVDDMDSALREMALRWGEMKDLKSGAMHDYFKDTKNPKAFKALMNAKDAVDAYKIITDEISKIEDPAKRNFALDEMFGGDSEKLIGVLAKGSKGLDDAKTKINEFGAQIGDDAFDNASAYTSALNDLLFALNSLKINTLVPLMGRLSETFKTFSNNLKNADWRDDTIKKVSESLVAIYNTFAALGRGILFISENWKGLIAILAAVKIAVFALNAVMLANPFGLIVAAISAVTVAIVYLISKFYTFDEVLSVIKGAFDGLMYAIKKVISFIPDALIPDSWSKSIQSIKDEIRGIDKMTPEIEANVRHSRDIGFTPISQMPAYKPLSAQNSTSKSSVDVTIKSEKPLILNDLKSDKKTDLKLNAGNMLMMY